jgi:hypothetical protein
LDIEPRFAFTTLTFMRLVSILALASTMLASSPGTAWSQITPFLGYNFGGDSVNCERLRDCDDKKANFGISIAKASGVFGMEQDISYVPHFFGKTPGEGNSMLTLMSSLMVIAPLGPVQPYGVLGLGLMRPHTILGAKNALGYNLGGGLTVYPTRRLGLRADVRRMRALSDVKLFVFSGEKLEFWRASLGLTLR